jgi:hypothetical protein
MGEAYIFLASCYAGVTAPDENGFDSKERLEELK